MDLGKLRRFLHPEKLIWLLLLLLLAERLVVFRELDLSYLSGADDVNYIPAGIEFARTGTVSYGSSYPSALIMPGMPVLIGLLSRLVGEGDALMLAARLLWCCFGVASAWVVYRTGKCVCSAWAGFWAACCFLIPNMAWMNHVILTETPYILFSSLCVFYTFAMERSSSPRWFVGYLISFLLALMFRSNIMLIPFFTLLWLLLRRGWSRRLLRRVLLFAAALLLVLTPWTIRNARQFGAFIPLTYGMGQPLLQGTYEGEGYPEDSELDYETNVHQVMLERYSSYYREDPEPRDPATSSAYAMLYDPSGEVLDLKHAQFLSMESDGVQARYRMRVWWENDAKSFLKSYLYIKPRWMLNWSWAWVEVLHTPYSVLHRFSQINMMLCLITVLLVLYLRRARAPVFFLGLLYIAQVYACATAFVTDRYASMLLFLRYLIGGIGISLLPSLLRKRKVSRTNLTERGA